jgi:putative peptide zinc metalloprotease protein
LQNVGLLLLAYPLVKLVHELGHAYAIKHGGGELHEMGVMMLVFMPVPYVDASAAAAFPNKWARAGVGAAGIIVELSLAAIAMILWLELEPGLLRAFLFNVMLIGGVSTLLFNGNPLLKFDGYYVLSDIIEIPNLGQRANRYIRYLVMGRLFGSESVTSPVTGKGEAPWFVFYAIAAFLYRIVVMLTIVFFVAGQAFVFGVVLAVWAVVLMYGLPLFKALRALFTSPDLRGQRGRAIGISGAIFAVVALGLGAVPVPSVTIAEGVISAGKGAPIVSEVTATVSRILVQADSQSAERNAVLVMADPLLEARTASLEADLRVIESRLLGASINDTAEARILRRQKERAEADLARSLEQIAQLTITTEKKGSIHLLRRADLPGRLVYQGDVVGYSLDPASYEIEVVVPQSRIDLIGAGDGPIALRLASQPKRAIPATVIRQTPSAITELPNPALSSTMGGQILTDPSDPKNIRTLEPVFRLTLASLQPLSSDLVGQKVFVRFDHGAEPLLAQAYRSIRQLFLARFNV